MTSSADSAYPPVAAPDGAAVLSGKEQRAWRGFLRFAEEVMGNVSRELVAGTGLSVPEFQVLIRLNETDTGCLEQRELTELLGWSLSRLSHLLSRMAARGLVERQSVGVGRLMAVELTSEGRTTIDAAMTVQAEAVRRSFFAAETADIDLEPAIDFFAAFGEARNVAPSHPAGRGPDGQDSAPPS